MKNKKNKKGVEPVITTVLLIVLTVIIVALVIAFVVPFVQKQMQETQLCYNARIEIKEACFNGTSNNLSVRIGRGSEKFNLSRILISASAPEATKTLTLNNTTSYGKGLPGILEEVLYKIPVTAFGFTSGTTINSIAIAPIVREELTEKTCGVTSKTAVSECASISNKHLDKVTLNISHQGKGTTVPPTGSYNHSRGENVTLTARPSLGYYLDQWIIDELDAGNLSTIQLTMNKDHKVVAVFSGGGGKVTLDISSEGNGKTFPRTGRHEYDGGKIIRLTAIPDKGYKFEHWIIDGKEFGKNQQVINLLMNKDHVVVAVFTSEVT